MILVRVDLTSAERITINDADHFSVQDDRLMVYKGTELVAQFRQWAYVMKDPEQQSAVLTSEQAADLVTFPKGATWVPPPNYKPLTIKPPDIADYPRG